MSARANCMDALFLKAISDLLQSANPGQRPYLVLLLAIVRSLKPDGTVHGVLNGTTIWNEQVAYIVHTFLTVYLGLDDIPPPSTIPSKKSHRVYYKFLMPKRWYTGKHPPVMPPGHTVDTLKVLVSMPYLR